MTEKAVLCEHLDGLTCGIHWIETSAQSAIDNCHRPPICRTCKEKLCPVPWPLCSVHIDGNKIGYHHDIGEPALGGGRQCCKSTPADGLAIPPGAEPRCQHGKPSETLTSTESPPFLHPELLYDARRMDRQGGMPSQPAEAEASHEAMAAATEILGDIFAAFDPTPAEAALEEAYKKLESLAAGFHNDRLDLDEWLYKHGRKGGDGR